MQDPACAGGNSRHLRRRSLAALFDRSPNFIAPLQGAHHRFVYANPSYAATDAEGRTVDRFVDCVHQPVCGAVQGIQALGTDATARVRSTALLQRHAATIEQLVRGIPFGLYVADADFVVRQTSEVALRAMGHFRHMLATGEHYHAPRAVERRAGMGAVEACDWRIERSLMPDGQPGAAVCFHDLSARQRRMARLLASERRMSAMLGSVRDLIRGLDRKGRCILANQRRLSLRGPPYAEAPGRTTAGRVPSPRTRSTRRVSRGRSCRGTWRACLRC